MNYKKTVLILFILHMCFTHVSQSQNQLKPIIVDISGIKYTLTYSSQNKTVNDSLHSIHVLIENNSDNDIYIPKISGCMQIMNRIIISCGYFNHSISKGEMLMTLYRVNKGESFEKEIIVQNAYFDNALQISLNIDFLTYKQKKKTAKKKTLDILSKKYEKKSTHITVTYNCIP